jgi:hypothetical protein
MSQSIVYEMSLRDMLSPKIQEAEKHVSKLESTMHSFGHTALKTIESLGVSFALFEGFEFVKGGVEEFHKLHEAEAQVRAGLASTHEVAGLTFEELEKGASGMEQQFQYTKGEIMNMQSVMLTFTNITKDKFGEAEQAVVDMATRLHTDLQSATIQVGKALQDPIHGITALRRVGVNFNETQTEMVKHMIATGQGAKAQAFILHELATEFGGSAKAAADADPLFRYNKLMHDLKVEVGEVATNLLHALTPAFQWVAKAAQDTVHWMKDHKDILLGIGIAVGTVTVGYGAYLLVSNAATLATRALTMGQWLLNAAMNANPIMKVVTVLGLAAGAVVALWHRTAYLRAGLYGMYGVVKEFGHIVTDVFMGMWHVIHGVFSFDWTEIKGGWNQAADAMMNAGTRMATSFKEGWDTGMAEFNKEQVEVKQHSLVETPKTQKNGLAAVQNFGTTKDKAPKAASGRNVTINMKIGNLIDKQIIQTTNLQESSAKIKEVVTQALLSAVNDSQVISGE